MNKYTKKRHMFLWAKRICFVLLICSATIFGFKTIANLTASVVVESDINALNKPVSILLMGGDTSEERGTLPLVDSIILLTINPNNERGNVSIDALSIPRDTRVDYVCEPGEVAEQSGKINGVYGYGYSMNQNEEEGIECTVSSVENLLDTEIDYYAYTDFEGLISIVDAIGGIDINVPYEFCEQDSKDNMEQICLTPGLQTINGEQALAYARQRKAINPETGTSGDDWERNIRQQEVIAALAKKIISNPTQYAGAVYSAVKNGAIIYNIDLSTLSKLANFAVNTYKNINNVLENQGDLTILLKSSSFNHQVAIDSSQNVFGLQSSESKVELSTLYPEITTSPIYYENTLVDYINFNYKATTIPTKKVDDDAIRNNMTIELSMVTIGTTNDEIYGTSDQIIDDETLEYYKEFVAQSKKQQQ